MTEQQTGQDRLAAEPPQGAACDASMIAKLSDQPIATCYQCQRCTSWCPVSEFMDLKPHQMVRLLQLGRTEEVYNSRSIWLCVGCAGCGASCPNDIDFHRLADTLQQTAGDDQRRKAAALTAFDRAFLATVRRGGRVHEIGMVMRFKLATRKFMADMKLGMWMFFRGKLKPIPRRIRGRKQVRELFAQAQRRKEGRS